MNILRFRHAPKPEAIVVPDEFGPVGQADSWGIRVMRGRALDHTVRFGPNSWHVGIIHPDGTYDDLGTSHNFLCTAGRDLIAAGQGQPALKEGAFTASSATSGTPSGGGMTADQYQGWRVYCPVTGLTTPPVYGNIGTNSTTVLTVDQWWNAADGAAATTPASTNGYIIIPTCIPRFMGLTTDSGAGAAGDTTLASEITTNGGSRTKCVYAHTPGNSTYTLQATYNITGTLTAIHRGALFTAMNTTAGGIMVFEAVLNQDATVGNLDTLQVTATVTLT